MADIFPYIGPLVFAVLITINIYRDRKFTARIENVKQNLEARPQNQRNENA
jgi:hypothetical protein